MPPLYEQVKSRVPDTPLMRDLIEAADSLAGLGSWSPPHGVENHWTDVILWGFSLWMTRSLGGVNALQLALRSEVLSSNCPKPETLAELSGAALCVALGAIAGERIPRNQSRTADWRMLWPVGAEVDVEVTVAKSKEKHRTRQALATNLAKDLFRPERDCDLVIDLTDPTVREDWEAVEATANTIVSGQSAAVPGRWEVRAQQITREPTVLFIGGQDPRPPWWSTDQARCFVFHGEVAGPEPRRAPPQVRVSFGVPYNSYVNPVMRKADAPQGAAGLPFLVVVDISELPGAFREIPRAVAGLLPFWKAVSGILLFHDLMGFDRVGWLWRLVRNPHAAVPLPESMYAGRADLSETMETGIRFTQESSEPKETT